MPGDVESTHSDIVHSGSTTPSYMTVPSLLVSLYFVLIASVSGAMLLLCVLVQRDSRDRKGKARFAYSRMPPNNKLLHMNARMQKEFQKGYSTTNS